MNGDTTAGTRYVDWTNLAFLSGTFVVAAVGTPWYVATVGLGAAEVSTFLALWGATGLSLAAGYHRLFTHRAYRAAWPVRLFFLVFGAGALETAAYPWAADHRLHHAMTDHDPDPYNAARGFWWAHAGWIVVKTPPDEPPLHLVRDLRKDPLVQWQARWYLPLALGVAFGIPLAVGLATGRVLGCLLIGGVTRIVVTHHSSFLINSLGHMLGRRPYRRDVTARDSTITALLTMGEGYHNYHHAFPFDYRAGVRAWQFDPVKWAIYLLARLGLATGLRRASSTAIQRARHRSLPGRPASGPLVRSVGVSSADDAH